MLIHLNKQQKQAVTHKSGPLLIIAGAGTGKTKVITHRIAHIIKKNWAKPDEILALTFTEKAASEMEERADILLPYGTYDLLVTTFHSFGEKFLKEYAPFVGLALDYKLLNKIDQLIFLRENIYELPLKILRPVTNPLSHINQFASLFSRLKEEAIEPKKYLKWAKDNLKKAKDKIEKEKAKIHLEAAMAYEKYEDLKKENNVLDFSDLIFLTYKLLKTRPEVRAKLQKQFKYILVDEFQDTNFLQNEIIKMIAGKNGNITVVGDDDQCLTSNTLIKTKEGDETIANIKKGEEVVTAIGKGSLGYSRINKKFKKSKNVRLITLQTEDNKKIKLTDNHILFSYIPKGKSGFFYVYLMNRQNLGWRIGVTNDLVTRLKLERSADKMIVLKNCQTIDEARFYENFWSLKYNLPTVCFKERSGVLIKGKWLKKLFKNLDTETAARNICEDLNIDIEKHQISLAAVTRGQSQRIKINLYLNYREYKSKIKNKILLNPKNSHCLHLETSNQKIVNKLKQMGYQLTRAKKGYRLRVQNLNFNFLEEQAQIIQQATKGIIEYKFIAGKYGQKNQPALMLPAKNIFPGFYIPVIENNSVVYKKIIQKQEKIIKTTVYDLEIDKTHNFIANNIIVHNSIYRWRGASISNILFFQKEYPKAKKIVLAQNYRSPQEVLDLAYQTIQNNNPDRLEVKAKINKRLIALESFKKAITFNYFDTVGSESDFVIAEIKNAKKKKIPLREIAIILRSNSLAGHYIKALNSAGIPYVFSGESGIYFKPEIQMIISLIKVLVSNRDIQAYYNLLKSNAYNIDSGDLAEIFDLIKYQSLSTFKTLQNIDTYEKNLHLNDVTIKKIKQFVQNIITLREKEKEVASGQLIYHFLKIKKILFNLSRKQSVENELKIKNIADFFNQVILEFEKVSRDQSISNLAKYVDDLLSVYASPEIEEIDPDMEAVRVLTYHASKGLEFEIVFMPALTSDYLPTRDRTELIDIPANFIHEILPEGNYHLQEERRLFYVGATRAKKYLFLTYAANYGGKRAKKISPFLIEALGEKALEKIKKVQLTKLQQIELFASAESNQKSLIETNRPISLNAYAIDDYNTCPLKYKFAKILRVPVMQSFPVAFGSSIHNALSEYYKKLLIGQKMNLQDLLKIFKQNWRNEGYMHKKHEQEALAQGKEAMKNFLNSEFSKTKPISTETPFSLNLDSILIRGRFDVIFPGKKGVKIFDFKSSFLGEEEGLRRARESLQLKLYAWAYYKIKKTLPESLGLVFLNSNHHAEITPTLRQLKSLEEKIRTTARGIRQKEFEATPSQFTCRYCAFRETCPFAYA